MSVTLTLHTYQNVPVTNLERKSVGQEGLYSPLVETKKETTRVEESGSYCFTAAETNIPSC